MATHKPRAHFGHVMVGHGHNGHGHGNGHQGGLLVHSDMDIVEQTQLFTNMDPFHQQFIPAPHSNAGELFFGYEIPYTKTR